MTGHPLAPSPALVNAAIREFEDDPDTSSTDAALTLLFNRFPLNDSLQPVLLKATAVNSLYATNVYALLQVARHILHLNIDPCLANGDPEIVDRVAKFSVKGKSRQILSFASKYCSWHRPEHYPIYDSFVARLLLAYGHRDGFSRFTETELRVYQRFRGVVGDFREFYGLQALTFKQLDKFLWGYGRRYFTGG